MRIPKPNIRRPKLNIGVCLEDSVLECDSPPPLFACARLEPGGRGGFPQPAAARCAHHALPVRFRLFYFCFLLSVFCIPVRAQYSLDWSTIDGGGGTSTGGVYSVSGTIGQPDAGGPMTNGQYSLTGGFWSLYAVQTPGAPLLTIKLTSPNTAMVWWPSPSTGFTLQQSTNLNTTDWATPPETVNDDGTNKFILVNPPAGIKSQRFYRLFKP